MLNAEYDDLRPSGQAFAAALAAAGVDVRQVMVTTMLHGFLNLPASIGPVGAALDLIAATLEQMTTGRLSAGTLRAGPLRRAGGPCGAGYPRPGSTTPIAATATSWSPMIGAATATSGSGSRRR